MAEQASVRRRTLEWEDPLPYVEQAVTMRPVEHLRRMLHGEIPSAPMGVLMNMEGGEIEEGRAVISATPGEEHYNPIGTVHGGYAMTLLDSAMGFAIHSTLPIGGFYSTLEVKSNFIRPMSAETGRVTCEAKVIHIGRSVGTAEGRIEDEHGRLLAHATCTCKIFPPPT
jgi:uncharacterized protein (TIGR00369 family)